MVTAKELIDLAEKCFQEADAQGDHDTAEALREKALLCLEDACLAPVRTAERLRGGIAR